MSEKETLFEVFLHNGKAGRCAAAQCEISADKEDLKTVMHEIDPNIPVLYRKVDELDLSIRPLNCIKKANIYIYWRVNSKVL